jgi:glycosyltransferase involved in cell wall biosynthesis
VKVLHVINTFGYGGGAERHLLALVEEQRRQGLDVVVAYLKPTVDAEAYEQQLARFGAEAHSLADRRRMPLIGAVRLARLVHRLRPDIVHSHLPRADIASALARRWPSWPGATTVSSVHNNEEFFRRAGYRQLLAWCYRSHGRVIAISDAVGSAVLEQFDVPAGRLVVVPYGIASAEQPPSPGREALGVDPSASLVGTLARVTRQKGIDVLLQAMTSLPDDVHCLVIGPDEPDAPALHALVVELGLASRVSFAGFRQDALSCL